MTARFIAAWLLVNLLPFSAFGFALFVAGQYFDQKNTRQARLVLGALVAGLIATVFVTTSYAVVVYDPCNDPSYPTWLWWLTCVL